MKSRFFVLRIWLPGAFASLVLGLTLSNCSAQTRPDLYNCEGCEAIYEHSFDDLDAVTTIASDDEPGEAMIISGTVFETDGITPAPGVILYVWHTNAEGVYPTTGEETGWGRRHGYLRGWMETDASGKYEFRTIRPGTYPNRTEPAHVHIVVKEPDRQEYWIDAYHFAGDPLLTEAEINSVDPRGGTGVIELVRDGNGIWRGGRDIVLEP